LDEKNQKADPLRNIRSYNDEMTISQVIRYFERQGVFFTKPMIQGYVRAGLLPPLKERHYYTRAHMVLLAMIESLKRGFSSEEIRRLFGALGARKAFPGAGTDLDDSAEMLAAYEAYTALTKEIQTALNGLSGDLAANAENAGAEAGFLVPAALMAGSVMLREMAGKMLTQIPD